MIDEIRSIADVWRKMPSEHHARVFLEDLIWRGERHCPHCGSTNSTRLAGETCRRGLYQCRERECRRQFSITTKTPHHATKLDLRIWISAIFIVLTSSKGVSSVVMGRLLVETGAHVNTAEAVNSQVQRALVGVYHNLGRQHLQRYLDEIVWRWNHRAPVREAVKQWTTKAGVEREKTTTIWRPIPVVEQMRLLLQGSVGKQLRRSKEYGLYWP